MPVGVGNIVLAFGPGSRGAPDDLWTDVASVLKHSWTDLMVATQQLADQRVVNAMIRVADRRNCRVRVLLEEDYLLESPRLADPWAPGGDNEASRAAFAALTRSAIRVRFDRRSGSLFHANVIVAKGNVANESAVLISSANFNRSNLTRHYNASVAIRGEIIASALESYFDSGWTDLSASARTATVAIGDGGSCTVIAGADGACPNAIAKLIDEAKHTIDVAMFNIAVGSVGFEALLRAITRGVGVRGVVDGDQKGQGWDAVPALRAAGADVRYMPGVLTGGVGRMHQKTLLIDDEIVSVSTANLSGAARSAQEIAVVLSADGAARPWSIAQFAKAELDRLFVLGQLT